MQLYGNPDLTGHERILQQDEVIVSKTDLTGKMTYVNQTFCKIAGLKEKDCLGVQHNLIRHPEMPRCVFALLWERLKAKKEVFAYVNNRAANGDSYWVFAHVTPSFNDKGDVVGYHSNRRAPNRDILKNHIIPLYGALLAVEKGISSPRDSLQLSSQKVYDLLKEKDMSFNEYMFSLR